MTTKTHAELKDEAKALGLEFKGNTSKDDLIKMIDEFYDKEAEESKVEVRTDLTPEEEIDDALEEVDTPELPNRVMKRVNNLKTKQSKEARLRKMIKEAKERAFKKRVVTLSNNDTRENQHTTAVPLFFENQYFALDRIVPLNVPVELEQCLIDIAKSTTIAIHKKEATEGGRVTGRTVFAKKFNISYEDMKD